MYSTSNPDITTVDPSILAIEGGLRRSNAPQHQIDALYQNPVQVRNSLYFIVPDLSF